MEYCLHLIDTGAQMEGLGGAQLPRRLDMSASAPPKQMDTPAGQQVPPHTQPTPSEAFFASATPLEHQHDRAMRQVLQEQVSKMTIHTNISGLSQH